MFCLHVNNALPLLPISDLVVWEVRQRRLLIVPAAMSRPFQAAFHTLRYITELSLELLRCYPVQYLWTRRQLLHPPGAFQCLVHLHQRLVQATASNLVIVLPIQILVMLQRTLDHTLLTHPCYLHQSRARETQPVGRTARLSRRALDQTLSSHLCPLQPSRAEKIRSTRRALTRSRRIIYHILLTRLYPLQQTRAENIRSMRRISRLSRHSLQAQKKPSTHQTSLNKSRQLRSST